MASNSLLIMETYIAFLRGINVSGQKKIKMADLRLSLEKMGLGNIRTYIQSGNLVFQSNSQNKAVLEEQITQQIAKDFGFEVPVIITSPNAIQQILEHNPFKAQDLARCYFVFLKNNPDPEHIDQFYQLKYENEQFHITDSCVYLYCNAGYGKAKLNNNLIEQKLKVMATTRNLRTLQKMLELAD